MNLGRSWGLKIDPRVYKELKGFPKEQHGKLIGAIELLGQNPYAGDIAKVQGERNTWRRRLGAYRIFYEIHQNERLVHVMWVERRTSKTY